MDMDCPRPGQLALFWGGLRSAVAIDNDNVHVGLHLLYYCDFLYSDNNVGIRYTFTSIIY